MCVCLFLCVCVCVCVCVCQRRGVGERGGLRIQALGITRGWKHGRGEQLPLQVLAVAAARLALVQPPANRGFHIKARRAAGRRTLPANPLTTRPSRCAPRLDRDLTIGQMQGKFQLVLMPTAGHAIQEDEPDKTAEHVAAFLHRFRVGEPPMAIPRAAGTRPVLPVVAGPLMPPGGGGGGRVP